MLQAFLNNARLLSQAIGITPLLYGSLGLEYLTGKEWNADDIDILIPKRFLSERWSAFRSFLEAHGYALTDAHEHTFQKDGIAFSYAQLEELETFAGIPVEEIEIRREDDVSFYLLSPEQYHRVYAASIKDGYRITVRAKKDSEKLSFLDGLLKQ